MPERAIRRYSCFTFIYSQGRNRVPTSLIRFVFISALFSSAAVFSADNVPISTETSTSKVAPQPISNSQLPEWFYRELTSIRKDVSVLDATGASKEQIQELKERIGKVEVRLEESQLRVDDKLNEQSGRIGDLKDSYDSSLSQVSWTTTWFGIVAGLLGVLVAVIAIINSWKANREAVANAQDAAQKTLEGWTQEKEAELTEKFDQKLTELSAHHEKEFQKIRYDAVIQTAETDINRGISLAKDRSGDAIPMFDSVIKKFNSSNLIEHQRLVVDALYWKSFALDKPESYKEQIGLFDEIIEKFNGSEDTRIQNRISNALYNKGVILGKRNYSIEAIEVYRNLIERFQDSKDERTQNRIMKARVNMEIRQAFIEENENNVRAYENEINRFNESDDIAIQELLTKALVSKGGALVRLNRLEEAIAVYDHLLDRFKDSDNAAIQERIISAVCNKAELVLATQPKDQAIKAIQNAIALIKEGSKVDRAVMEMLSLIINESTVDKVYSCVVDIPNDAKLTWEFGSIREVVDTLEFPRKEQVQAFARYFEDHHDKAKLKEELDQISKL